MQTERTTCTLGVIVNVFRTRARTFWFAAQFLPADRRAVITQLYAFARAVDDLVDEPRPGVAPSDVARTLGAWRDWLDQTSASAASCSAAPDALLAATVQPVLHEHGVPAAYLQLLLDGVASDLTRREMGTWLELRTYCVQVASSVGMAMCHLLGSGADPLARDAAIELGIAMQLTNILRDVGGDLDLDRLYIPRDELLAFGYSRKDVLALCTRVRAGQGPVDDAFRALMRDQIARAREHYARGLDGVWRLPSACRLAILVAARLYRAILDAIEAADFDVFSRRASTSMTRKLAEAARCAVLVRLPNRASTPALPAARP
ncbi:MAG: phytoene/squalene synthase family protein [Chloroflexota bacterium]